MSGPRVSFTGLGAWLCEAQHQQRSNRAELGICAIDSEGLKTLKYFLLSLYWKKKKKLPSHLWFSSLGSSEGVGLPRPRLTPVALVSETLGDFKDDSKAVSPSLGGQWLWLQCGHMKSMRAERENFCSNSPEERC